MTKKYHGKYCAVLIATFVTILTMLLYTTTVFAEVTAQKPIGDGSTSSPYQITSAEELLWFANTVNGGNTSINADLQNDISLSGITNWTPIGNKSKTYSGTFNGNGNTITDMSINATPNKLGLFGYTLNATIKNLTVSGKITCTASTHYTSCDTAGDVGGIAGRAEGSSILNCTSNVAISDNGSNSNAHHVGGVVGDCRNNSTLSNCVNNGEINMYYSNDCVGGIAGYVGTGSAQTATIKACTNNGTIITKRSGEYTGGILGYVNTGTCKLTLSDCTNNGTVSGVGSYTGAVIGYVKQNNSITVESNYWIDSTSTAIGKSESSKITNAGSVYTDSFDATGGLAYLNGTALVGTQTTVTGVTVPSNVTEISSTFSSLSSLKSISIPTEVTLETGALNGCSGLVAYIYETSPADTYLKNITGVTSKYVIGEADGLYIATSTDTSKYDFAIVVDTDKFGGDPNNAQFLQSVDVILNETYVKILDSYYYSDDKTYAIFRCKFNDSANETGSETAVASYRGELTTGENSTVYYVTEALTR